MSYIHFFDFDIRGHDEILFHNWISINIAAKMNPGKEIILWLTKEIKTNYYLLEIIKKFHIRSWNDNFSNCRIANDLDKVLCKLLTLQKYPGSSLDLNDVHITPQPVHLRGLNFISENPQKYPLEVKHNFIVCNDEKCALDSTISDLAKARRQTSGLVIPAILHADVANRFVFANGIENSEFSCYLSSANGLEKLFVDRSNEIPDQSF